MIPRTLDIRLENHLILQKLPLSPPSFHLAQDVNLYQKHEIVKKSLRNNRDRQTAQFMHKSVCATVGFTVVEQR